MTLGVGNLGIDGLEDIELIGTGGSSRVYRARQADLDRVVAVKVLNPGHDQSVSKRFDRERKAMGRLSLHEGIVPVYSSGITAHGEPYLVMPYYANGSLQDQIDTGAMEWQTAVSYVDIAAETIAAAHDEGVVHLDLKPANILLTNHGAPRIADFGIAKLMSGQGASAGTTGGAAFTPAYSAPETFLDGETGPPSDVYGLGATLWALLVGHPPFLTPGDDTNLMAVIGRVVNNSVGDLRHFTPSPICEVIERAMAKRPEERFLTARAFSTALKNAAAASSPDFRPSPEIQGTVLFPAGLSATASANSAPTQMLGQVDGLTAQRNGSALAVPATRPLLQETAQPTNRLDGNPTVVGAPAIDFDRFKTAPLLLGMITLLGIIGLGLFFLSRNDESSNQTTFEVPVSNPAGPTAESGQNPTTIDSDGEGTPAGDDNPDQSSTTSAEATNPGEQSSTSAETTTTIGSTTSSSPNTTSSGDPSSTQSTTTTTEGSTTSEAPSTTAGSSTTEAPSTTADGTPTSSSTPAPTEPPSINDDLSTSSTSSSITASFSATQCVTYRVSATEVDGSGSPPVVRTSGGAPCATSHAVTVDGLKADTLYSVSVIVTNEAGQRSTAKVARRRTK